MSAATWCWNNGFSIYGITLTDRWVKNDLIIVQTVIYIRVHEKSKPYKHCMVIINANERDSCCF